MIFKKIFYAFSHTVGVLAKTKRVWPLKTWLNFWLTNSPGKNIEINGFKFAVRGGSLSSKLTDMYVILENVFDKAYLQNFQIKSGAEIIDIGAHIGGFSVSAAPKSGKIYAFEPFADNYNFLKKNIALSRLSNVIPFNLAVASTNGEMTLYVAPMNTSAHSLTKTNGQPLKVRTISLENIFLENSIEKCDLLKMDCEGGEYDIILNTPTAVLQKISLISLEYHMPIYWGMKDNSLYEELINKLKSAGFKVDVKKENYQRGYINAKR